MSAAIEQTIISGVAPGTLIDQAITLTAGRTVVINIMTYFAAAGLPTYTVTDDLGNTYTQVDETGVGQQFGATQFYAYNVLGGATTIHIRWGGASNFVNYDINEISGLTTTDPLIAHDKSADGGTTGITSTTPTLNPIQAGITIACNTDNQGATETLTSAGWAVLTNGAGSNSSASAYKLHNASEAVTGTWSLSVNSAWWNVIASYKEATVVNNTLPFSTQVGAQRMRY